MAQQSMVSSGNYGELSTFSFFPSKNLGGFGDAGCVVTNSMCWKSVRRLRNHGQIVKNKHQELGRNSRLTGSKPLSGCEVVTSRRHSRAEEAAAYYVEHLSNASVKLPPFIENRRSVYHQFVIRTNDGMLCVIIFATITLRPASTIRRSRPTSHCSAAILARTVFLSQDNRRRRRFAAHFPRDECCPDGQGS